MTETMTSRRTSHRTARRASSRSRTLAAVVTALLGALVASLLLVPSTSTAAAEADPPKDWPILPTTCVGDGEFIPQQPMACQLTAYDKLRPTVVLWGDSHAWQYVPSVLAAVKGKKINVVGFLMGGCPPVKVKILPQGANYPSKCHATNAMAITLVRKLERTGADYRVLLGAHWAGYRRAYREGGQVPALATLFGYDDFTMERVRLFHRFAAGLFPVLGKIGAPVDVIGQTATVPRLTLPCLSGSDPYACDMLRGRALYDEQQTHDWLAARMKSLAPKPRLINVNGAYCNEWVCHGTVGDTLTFSDALHLSATRTKHLKRFFVASLRNLV